MNRKDAMLLDLSNRFDLLYMEVVSNYEEDRTTKIIEMETARQQELERLDRVLKNTKGAPGKPDYDTGLLEQLDNAIDEAISGLEEDVRREFEARQRERRNSWTKLHEAAAARYTGQAGAKRRNKK